MEKEEGKEELVPPLLQSASTALIVLVARWRKKAVPVLLASLMILSEFRKLHYSPQN